MVPNVALRTITLRKKPHIFSKCHSPQRLMGASLQVLSLHEKSSDNILNLRKPRLIVIVLIGNQNYVWKKKTLFGESGGGGA